MSNIIDIGEVRLKRDQRYTRPAGECRHVHITLDDNGDVVRCDECGIQLSPYWLLTRICDEYSRALAKINARERAHREAMDRALHLTAAQRVEKAWRSRTMVPCCPHCGEGIRATDGLGSTMINRDIDDRRRAAKGSGA